MNSVFLTFRNYMGTGLILILFLLALVYLFLFEDRKPRRILFIYFPILVLLLFFNPLFVNLYVSLDGEETYFRICWLLPYLVVLPYTVVLIVEKQAGKRALYTVLAAAALFVAAGKLVYSNPLYSRAENIYHVPDSVVHICDAIEVPGREVRAVFPEELLLYVRQYSPLVCMPYGREVLMGVYDEMHEIMELDEIDLKRLLELTGQRECHFIVFREDAEFVGEPAGLDLELFLETDGYIVYRNNSVPLVIYPIP